MSELGPREDGKTQINGRGVERIEFLFEAEFFIPRRHGSATLIGLFEKGLKEIGRPLVIGVG